MIEKLYYYALSVILELVLGIFNRNPLGYLSSLVNSNSTQAHVWLAASRIEEKDYNIKAAKVVLQKVCIKCPNSEDIWLEATWLVGA